MLDLSPERTLGDACSRDQFPDGSGVGGPVDAYLSTLSSEASRRTMTSALRTITSVVSGGTILCPDEMPWWQLRPSDVSRLRLALARTCGSPFTANLRLAAVRGVLRECWRGGWMTAEAYRLAVDFRPVRGSRLGRGRHVEPHEIEALLCVCDASVRGHRDRAMLALLFGLGIRRSELVGLDIADIDLQSGRVTIRRGKGNRQRAAYLPEATLSEVAGWLRVRGDESGPLLNPIRRRRTDEHIATDRRLSSQTVYDSVRRLFGLAGVSPFSPHDARRTLIANLLDAGVDISTVARVVGHSQVTTTSRYDRRGERAVFEASRRVRIPSSGGRST
jgi:integrase